MRLKEDVNDIRTNIIELLVRLYKNFDDLKEEVHLSYEKYFLHYIPQKGLWLDNCIDQVSVTNYAYANVQLGEKIRSYGQIPYHWLNTLLYGDNSR